MDLAIYGNSILSKILLLGLANTEHNIIWLCPNYKSVNRPIAISNKNSEFLQAINQFTKNKNYINIWQMINPDNIQKVFDMNIYCGNNYKAGLQLKAYPNFKNQLSFIINSADLDASLDTALNFSTHIRKIQCQNLSYEYCIKTKINKLIINSNYDIDADLLILTQSLQQDLNFSSMQTIEKNYSHKAITAILQSKEPHYGVAYQWFYNKDVVALLPMVNNQFCLVWSTHNSENIAKDVINNLNNLVPATLNFGLTMFDENKAEIFDLKLKYSNKMHENSTVIIGDAAHKIHPLAGQGLNLGIRDAIELLSTIQDISKSNLHIKLKQFSARRWFDIFKYSSITDGLYNINNTAPNLINFGFNVLNYIEPLKKIIVKTAN